MQYLATDRGECAGLKTGSLQNLRAELGVGASHKLGENTLVFGELSFIGDMVRNNPTADLGGMRLRGSNPGRAGINLSVGAPIVSPTIGASTPPTPSSSCRM